MTPLLDLAIRSSVLVALGLALAALLRRQPAALRHTVLATAIVAAVAVIPLSVIVPAWHITLPSPAAATPVQPSSASAADAGVSIGTIAPTTTRVPLMTIVWVFWVAGV